MWPDGTLCVNRLTAPDLSVEDTAAALQTLRDPQALIDEDDGAMRLLLLPVFAVPNVDMQSILDHAYESVEVMDVVAGRGDIREGDLGSVSKTLRKKCSRSLPTLSAWIPHEAQ